MSKIRKYWCEIVVFSAILFILLMDLAPNLTWINTCSDGVHYIFASKNLYLSHKTSAPLFLLLGKLFLWLPFGSEFWRMGLISVFSTFIASILVYLSIKVMVGRRGLALLGALMYGSSAIVISQSTIVETYPLVTMLGISAYYYALKKKWASSSLMMALGLAVHHLIGLIILPLLMFNKELRRPRRLLILASGLLFYLYIPISVYVFHSPDIWGNTTVSTFFGDNFSTMMMLVGGLSTWDLPKRLLDTIGVVGVSLGLGVILVGWYFIKEKKLLKNQLFWLFILGILYYFTNLAPQTYVYIMPSIAFGAIITAIQLSKINHYWLYATALVAIGLSVFNANYFDIGRTLDRELSANKFYNKELSKIPDGQILLAQYGWEWVIVYPYNKNEHRNIIPVDIGTLLSPVYQKQLKEQGILLTDNYDDNMAVRQSYIANSIVNLNDNVWTTKVTDARTYGAEVVRAREYPGLVNMIPTEPPAQLHWKPSNPYDIISGSIEVEEWRFITVSNKNIRFYFLVVVYSIIPYFLLLKYLDKRKRLVAKN